MGLVSTVFSVGCFLVAPLHLEQKMNAWPQLFFGSKEPSRARRKDPTTSHEAAAKLSTALSHCATLLETYQRESRSLTDEEASRITGLEGAWKRCSDLRNQGLIRPIEKRTASTGRRVQACIITQEGRDTLSKLRPWTI